MQFSDYTTRSRTFTFGSVRITLTKVQGQTVLVSHGFVTVVRSVTRIASVSIAGITEVSVDSETEIVTL